MIAEQPSPTHPVSIFPHVEILRALRALAGRDDGARMRDDQGFNATDTNFGRSLAGQEKLTDRQAFAGHRLLFKYRAQLYRLGIDYDALPRPAVALEQHGPGGTAPAARSISWGTDAQKFIVRFAFDRRLVEDLKANVDGRRFDAGAKVWTVPLAGAEPLQAFAARHGFTLSPGAERVFGEMLLRREASRATDADIDIPSLNGELRPFQRAGVQFALRAKRVIIADEMGLGKSVQAIATIEAANAYPALIVCPASLKLNWRNEWRKFAPHRNVEILSGRAASNPLFARMAPAEVSIVNYDVLAPRVDELTGRDFAAVVFDESHYLKERKAQRTVAAKKIAKDREYRLLLTGTPVLNRPKELIPQLDTIDQLDNLGGWYDFNSRYVGAMGTTVLQELNKRMRSICLVRRLKRDVLTELPAKQRTTVPLELTNRKDYDTASADVIAWLREQEGLEAADKAASAEQLVRIEKLKMLAAQGKLKSAVEWLREFVESGEKIVVFAHHVEIQRELIAAFPTCAYILGESDPATRQAQVDRFQNERAVQVIVCSLKAGGVGITLTAASNVAFLELPWGPADLAQAEDRVHRIGQRDAVTAWYLLAEKTIDDYIAEMIMAKARIVDAATEGRPVDDFDLVSAVVKRLIA